MNRLNRPIMTYHGGKWRLADWIISYFPPHRIYVEPFGGAASVLMKKPRSLGEVYNDLDDEIVNVMQVLQDAALCEQLAEVLSFTRYARAEFKRAKAPTKQAVERARRTLIRAQMGFGSAGATKPSTGFRLDVKHHAGGNQRSWAQLPQRLQDFGLRLQGVLLENRPALQVLRDHDTRDTLFYADPPYLHATRRLSGAAYRYEMSAEDHAELLNALHALKGRVVLSGCPHPLYDDALRGWRRVERHAQISVNKGGGTRIEVLWLSPNISLSVMEQTLALDPALPTLGAG